MMLKQVLVLVILSHSAFCRFTPNERQLNSSANQGSGSPAKFGYDSPEWMYCEDECSTQCKNCTVHKVCNYDTHKFCKYGPCLKSPNGLELCDCPRDEKCVKKGCTCPAMDSCAPVCEVNCSNTTKWCPGEKKGDCPAQPYCRQRDMCAGTDDYGPGFCPLTCTENEWECTPDCEEEVGICRNPNDHEDVKIRRGPNCCPKQKGKDGTECTTQFCKRKCTVSHHYCEGFENLNGCKEEDSCEEREICSDCPDKLCPGVCPVGCGPDYGNAWNQMKCIGPITYYDNGEECPGQDTCKVCTTGRDGKCCPEESHSHDCPKNCPKDHRLCPGQPGDNNCKTEAKCVEKSKDNTPDKADCPEHSDCPCHCADRDGKRMVCCDAGTDYKGCKNKDICIAETKGYDGNACPFHCPKPCDANEICCPGRLNPRTGCYDKDECIEKQKHQWGNNTNEECPAWCPVHCEDNEVLCPSLIDPCNGCPTEEICRAAIKDKNEKYCPGKEYVPHINIGDGLDTVFVRDPTRRGKDGATRRGGYLSASHNCPHYCNEKNNEVLCPVYENTLGCKPKAECLERKKDADSKDFCPCDCPLQCPPGKKLCRYPRGAKDESGCHLQDICVDVGKKTDLTLCEQTWCPIICKISEGLLWDNSGKETNGCPKKPTCTNSTNIIAGTAVEAVDNSGR